MTLYKLTNVLDERGRPVIDAKTRRPKMQRVAMTDEEAAAFEAMRAAEVEANKAAARMWCLDRLNCEERIALVRLLMERGVITEQRFNAIVEG